jgi:uncharacterized RDD family membrane protein YckC
MTSATAPAIAEDDTRVSGRRYLAHVVDGVVLMVILILMLIPTFAMSDIAGLVALILWFGPVHLAYFVLAARRTGQTPGKRAAAIRVVDEDGRVPSTGALVKRSLPLLIEYFYILAWISMMASPLRQRFGDRWARTYVVKA